MDRQTLAGATTTVELQRHTFDAMGTDFEFLLDAEPSPGSAAALRRAETEIHRLEALLSRFRPDSELSQLNRAGKLVVGDDLLEVTELALAAREHTGGRFDPTVHDAVVAAGYDRTFKEVPADGPTGTPIGARCGGRVTIDRRRGTIELEPGFRLDLGGIGKGYAIDQACDLLGEAGPCLVNAGGDLAVRGRPRDETWPVGLEMPSGTLTLGLDRGALATSGRDRRRWRRGDEERHHLIDPFTARPSATDLLRVTVVAGTAVEAEVLAKALFLAGEREAVREADELGIPCVLVTEDGRRILAGGLG